MVDTLINSVLLGYFNKEVAAYDFCSYILYYISTKNLDISFHVHVV